MIDLTLKYCTYETVFTDGHFYRGKGITARVVSGAYTGSGVRYSLAAYADVTKNGKSTSVTTIVTTHATEDEAYEQEALFVPLELLMDPFCLNSTEGGRKGKFRNHSTLLKSIKAEHKREVRASRAKRAMLKKEAQAAKIKDLQKQLKDKK